MRLRRWMPLLPVILCACLLSACAHSTPSARVVVELPALDGRLAAPCAKPVRLSGDLTATAVQAGWARDRAALASCGAEKAALVDGYGALRQRLIDLR